MKHEINGKEPQISGEKGLPTRGKTATMIQVEEGAGNVLTDLDQNPGKLERRLSALKRKLDTLSPEERELLARTD